MTMRPEMLSNFLEVIGLPNQISRPFRLTAA